MPDSPFGGDIRSRNRALILAMWLFLAALAMFFVAAIAAYVVSRFTLPARPELGTIQIPRGLTLSTLLLVASSYTLHRGLVAIRRERQATFVRNILYTATLGVGFVIIQVVCLDQLLANHWAVIDQVDPTYRLQYYGLIFTLVLIHGLHVVGGLVPMAIVTSKALQGRYDHESHMGVTLFAMYWHFLDVIWVLMIGTFLLLG